MKRIRWVDENKTVELFDAIVDPANIRRAVLDTCRGHMRKATARKAKDDPEPFVELVKKKLEAYQDFRFSRIKEKWIIQHGKWRHVQYADDFVDCAAQHAVMNIVGPILMKSILGTSYGAIPGRGLHEASRKLKNILKKDPSHTRFCLKIDISQYFGSIPRDKLFEAIKRKIKCPRTLEIIKRMIDGCPGVLGILIGLFLSQILSAFYLSDLDHYVHEVLAQKYSFRYADDIVFLSGSKDILHNVLRLVREKLDGLGLKLKGNYQIFPVMSRGVDFLGYIHRHTHTGIRKRNKIAYKRCCNNIVRAIRRHEPVTPHMLASKISYEGMLGWCDSRNLVKIHDGRVYRAIEFGADAV